MRFLSRKSRNRDNFWKDREFLGGLFRLAAPIALQNLMLALVAAADAFMLGRLAQDDMSAVSLATQIQFLQNMVLSAWVAGFSILGAQYRGKGNRAAVDRVFFMTARICLALSAATAAACVAAPERLMRMMTDNADLAAIGVRYLRIAGWSYLLTGVSQCYLTLLKVVDRARPAAVISSSTVVLNIALNALLIFGLCGAPRMGVEGAAAATLAARAVELVWSAGAATALRDVRPRWTNFFGAGRALFLDYWNCVPPILGACVLWSVGFASYTMFMGHLGKDASAANAVASVVRDLVCCLCNGISSGGGILIGYELGAGRMDRGRLFGDRLVRISFYTGYLSIGIMLAATPFLLSFMETEAARGLLTGMMLIMAFYMIGRVVNTIVINGIFSAGGDTAFDFYSLCVCMWGIAVPLAALGTFRFGWNPLVVYACTCLDEVGKIPWVMHHYRRYKWVRNLTRAE